MPVRNLDVALSDYTGCLCKRSFKAPQIVLFECVRAGSTTRTDPLQHFFLVMALTELLLNLSPFR